MSDDLSFLVQETFRVNELRQNGILEEELEDGEEFWTPAKAVAQTRKLPQAPGLFFHLAQQSGTFIIRTLASANLALDHASISQHPEEYPSLRLVSAEGSELEQLDWFTCDSLEEAQMVHARVGHRRFPLREEEVCNLSDPGFSWWLESRAGSFTLYSKRSVLKAGPESIGPLADPQLAPHRWQELTSLLAQLPLELGMGMEGSRYYMSAAQDAWVVDEFSRVFREGVISPELNDLFRLLNKRGVPTGQLETCWFFLSEMAAIRRFWLAIEDRLS